MLLGVVGAGCTFPTDRSLTRMARQAFEEARGLAQGVRLDESAPSVVYPAKNAACVSFPCSYTNEKGQEVRGSCVVWMHRIRYRWELERFDLIPEGTAVPGAAGSSP